MTDRPFWEERVSRPVQPPTTTALVIAAVIAFVGGIGAMFAVVAMFGRGGGDEADAIEAIVFGLVIVTLAVAGVLTVALYLFVGRRSGNRGGGQDFGVLAGTSLTGSLLILGVLFVLGLPVQQEKERIIVALTENARVMKADAEAFDAEFHSVTGGGRQLLSVPVLARDPGLKATRRKLASGKTVVARYRDLMQSRQLEGRRRLGEAVTNEKRRKIALDGYDRDIRRQRGDLARYWDLQDKVLDDVDAAVVHLASSPGRWGPNGYIFNREADFDRSGTLFRNVDKTVRELNVLTESIQSRSQIGPTTNGQRVIFPD